MYLLKLKLIWITGLMYLHLEAEMVPVCRVGWSHNLLKIKDLRSDGDHVPVKEEIENYCPLTHETFCLMYRNEFIGLLAFLKRPRI